jgi:phage major head subunit gpT-like protein
MALDTSKYITAQRSLTKTFRDAAEAARPFYPTVCNEVDSNGADEQYGMLGAMPGVREWLGDRKFDELKAADFTIKNRHWQSGLAVLKTSVDDDRLGMYGNLMGELGNEAAHHPDELWFEALSSAESTACFDGQFFFDTDHVWGSSGTQSNDLTKAKAATLPTVAEAGDAYEAARQALMGFKNDQGKLLNRTGMEMSNLLLLCPQATVKIFTEALAVPLASGGGTNVVIDRPQIRSFGQLSDPTKFYLFNLSGSMRPFVFQRRAPITTGWKGADDMEFKELKFMTEARYNIGYLAWWKAVLTTFTGP